MGYGMLRRRPPPLTKPHHNTYAYNRIYKIPNHLLQLKQQKKIPCCLRDLSFGFQTSKLIKKCKKENFEDIQRKCLKHAHKRREEVVGGGGVVCPLKCLQSCLLEKTSC